MKRYLLMAALAVVTLAGQAQAQTPEGRNPKEVRFCSGGEQGMYYKVAGEIGTRLAQAGYHVIRVKSDGSVANLKLMMNPQDPKACDVALAQKDAIRNFFTAHSDAKTLIRTGAPIYDEAVHFLCNAAFAKKEGITRVPNIRKFGEAGNKSNFSVAIGPLNSGVNETWISLGEADPSYKKIATSSESGLDAVEKIVDGSETQCMIWTAALNTDFMKEVNRDYGGKVIMLGFDDSDLDNAKDQTGKPIYTIGEIPSGTYDNVQPSGALWGTKSVKTAFVAAQLIYSKEWVDRTKGLSDLIRAKNAAAPTIEQIIKGAK